MESEIGSSKWTKGFTKEYRMISGLIAIGYFSLGRSGHGEISWSEVALDVILE